MKLGVALPMAGDWATPDNQILIAQRAEALGYHSLWVFVEPKPVQKPHPPITIGGYGRGFSPASCA